MLSLMFTALLLIYMGIYKVLFYILEKLSQNCIMAESRCSYHITHKETNSVCDLVELQISGGKNGS